MSNLYVDTNIKKLLNKDNTEFLVECFRTILGRNPDEDGLIYYSKRLKEGRTKVSIISEILSSKEAENGSWIKSQPETKKLKNRYMFVRDLPLGRFRWTLLPKYGYFDDGLNFDWDKWAINYIRNNINRFSLLGNDVSVDSIELIKSFYVAILGREPDKNELETSFGFFLEGKVTDFFNTFFTSSIFVARLEHLYSEKVLPNDPPIKFLRREQRNSRAFIQNIIDRPAIYVIIPSYEDWQVLTNCLESIQKFGAGLISKIIISDDCSKDPAHLNYLTKLENGFNSWNIPILVLRNQINRGFSANVNRCYEHVPLVTDTLLLNSDTELTEYSVECLATVARQNGGIVGARLLYPDSKIQHGGGFRNFNAMDWFEHRYRMKEKLYPPALTSFNTIYCTGAALYITHETKNCIGVFDERFQMGFEDVDYCLRAWLHRLPVTYCGSAEIIHHESITRGKKVGEREAKSKEEFWLKYDNFYQRTVRDSTGKIKIIFVTKDTGVGGGHRVIFRFANYLASCNESFTVEIWSLAHTPDWFVLSDKIKFRTFQNFPQLETSLYTENAIKIATWWETAEFVWRASIVNGMPAWLSLDIESSYYKNRDTFNEMRATAAYSPDFIYITAYKWLGETLANDFYFHSNYVGLGVDRDAFFYNSQNRKNKSVLVCARGEPLKGFDLSHEIIRNLVARGFNVTVYGLEIGLVADIAGINFIYKPTNEVLNQLYNTHEFFLQTSIHEGLSLPPLEAMSAKCIPVVTDAFGNREYIQDEINCLVIGRSVAEAISRIENNPYVDLLKRLEVGMENTLQTYEWSKCYERVNKLMHAIDTSPVYGKTKFLEI